MNPSIPKEEPGNNVGRLMARASLLAIGALASAMLFAQCDPLDIPYSENFDAVTTPDLPECMSIETLSGNPWTTKSAVGTMTGNVANVSYTSTGSPNMDSWLFTPGLNLEGGTSYRLTYKYFNNSTYYTESMAVAYGDAANAASMTSPLQDHPSITTTNVQDGLVDFTPSTTGVYYIGFKCYSIANQNQLYLDDIQVMLSPTCLPPQNVHLQNMTDVSVELTWDDNASESYNYEVRTSGEPGSGAFGLAFSGNVASGTPPIELSPLELGTTYTAYVQGSCDGGADPSTWTGALQFTPGMVQIGSGETTTNYLPVYGLYGYNYSQQIYLASEYGGQPYISKIAFKYTGTSSNPSAWNQWTVYLGNTNKAAFDTDTDWIPLMDMQQAFSGTVDPIQGEWMEIRLDEGFLWDGTSNLVVAVHEYAQGYSGSTNWASFAAPDRAMHYYADSPAPDPANPPTEGGSSLGRRSEIAQIQIFGGDIPSCFPPIALSVHNISANTAEFSWAAHDQAPLSYDWEIREYGEPGSGSDGLADSGTNTGTITNTVSVELVGNTHYNFYVRANCSPDDQSTWAGPVSFLTSCDAIEVPYFEDFEEVTTPNIPPCMSIETIEGNPWITGTGTAGMTGNAAKVSWTSSGSPDMNSWLYTAGLMLQGGTSYRLTYKYTNNSSSYTERMAVHYGQAPEAASMTHQLADHPSINGLELHENQANFIPDESGVYYIGFKCYSIANQLSLYLDDIQVVVSPDCEIPLHLGTLGVTENSAELVWENSISNPSSGYEWEVRTEGEPGSGTEGLVDSGATAAGDTTASAGGLEAETHYYLYVRSNCGDEDGYSEWAGPFMFFTGYCEVESTNTSYGISNFTTTGGFLNINNTTGPGTYTNYSDQHQVVTQPNMEIDFSITGISSSQGYGIWIDWNNNMSFDDPGEMVFNSGGYVNGATGSFTVPDGQPEGTYRMRVVGNWLSSSPQPCGNLGNASYGEAEDYAVVIGEAPACMPITGLTLNGVTFESASFSWNPSITDPDGYNWEVRISGAPGSGPDGLAASGSTADTSATANDLAPETEYSLYVQADCGDAGESVWMGPLTLYTGYCQVTSTNTTYGISNFTTTGGSVNINNSTGPGTYTNYSDQHQVVAQANTEIEFSVTAVTGSMGIGIWIDWNNNMSFDDPGEMVYNSDGYTGSATGTFTIPDGQPEGTYRMRVVGNWLSQSPEPCGDLGNAGYGEAEDYAVVVGTPPTCMPITDLATTGVTAGSASFSWTASTTDPEGYNWEVRTSGAPGSGSAGLAAEGSTDQTSATASGLDADTEYSVYVQADCGDEDGLSTWIGPVSAYTGYCQVTSTNTQYGIANVTTTGGQENISNASGVGTYTNYSDEHIVSANAGDEIGFSITPIGDNTMGFGVWIDWNKNLSFDDPGEMVYNSGGYVAVGAGTFTIPAGTPDGSYRMRIVANYLANTPIPCGNLGNAGYGEAEDYTVEVLPAELDCNGTPGGTALPGTPCISDNGYGGIWNDDCECEENIGVGELDDEQQFAVYPNPASTELYITTPGAMPVHVKVYDMLGHLVMEADKTVRLNIAHLAPASYILQIMDDKGDLLSRVRFMTR